MSDDDKKLKVVFAPGCFDHLDVTQEELDKLMAEIQERFANMTVEDMKDFGTPLSEEDYEAMPDEIKAQIDSFGQSRKLQ